MIHIQIAKSILPFNGPLATNKLLEQAVRQTLQQSGAPPEAELTIVLTDDAQLHSLNQQFLGIDAPTDVLSFPGGDTDPDSQSLYLGDVLISYPRALAQATSAGHNVEEELQLLVVHGVLHLLGHDHATEEEQAAMWAVQTQALQSLGVSIRP
jgi:probable rRNA maturation factor